MEVRENLLRFVDTMQTKLGNGARRPVRGVAALAVLLVAGGGMATGQIAAPRYQSPIEAPKPQLNLPTPPPRSSPDAAVLEDVIVRVNDQIIDRGDVERNAQQLADGVRQGKLTAAEGAEAQKDMLRDMIDEQLLISRGKELDLNVDSEVVRQLDDVRKENKLDSMEALEKAVRESGLNYEDYKADIKNRIMKQMVIRDEVGRTLHRPSAKEVQAYYDLHKQEYEQAEQVELSEILIPTPDGATDAQIAQAQAKADEVETKLKAGGKFEDLAKQYSGGPTADKGGELGLFKRGTMGTVLDDQTFVLQAGESTAPIRTRQGFVVLKVTKHITAGAPPLKDVEDQVQEAMYPEMMQPALRKYLIELRSKAYIYIAPGFTDSGAGPNETKIVQQSATPLPVNKKAVVQQKQRLAPTRAAAAPAAGAAVAPAASGTSTVSSGTAAGSPAAKMVNVATGKKRKKVRREKVRFGQAPRNSLPVGTEETLAAGADQGAGATSSALPVAGPGTETTEGQTNVASNTDLLAPVAPAHGKTRYSDRAATEAETKAAAKVVKVKQKALVTAAPMTAEEKVKQQVQDAPLGLGTDTSVKKKKKREKGAPKERLQDQAPAPASAKPDATPIPPKSVRDNGEPAVLPVGGQAAPAAPADTQPSTPPSPPPTK
jgi:peptidyl-prolyl cis-trans isomerase SurA